MKKPVNGKEQIRKVSNHGTRYNVDVVVSGVDPLFGLGGGGAKVRKLPPKKSQSGNI